MRTRTDIEAIESKTLAPYAMKSQDAGARQYDEPQHEWRTDFQRDRDRIVHSEAFRKLEYKTQVFVIFEGDYYRTRLTHTIEVAQLARTLGRNLRLNEDLIEAIALAHDLGHPPFGHAGEDALNSIVREAKIEFNHNFRSYEIVAKLEKKYPHFDGLNLTREVLVGILKHATVFDMPGVDIPKQYRNEGPTLEAQIVDIAIFFTPRSPDLNSCTAFFWIGAISGYSLGVGCGELANRTRITRTVRFVPRAHPTKAPIYGILPRWIGSLGTDLRH